MLKLVEGRGRSEGSAKYNRERKETVSSVSVTPQRKAGAPKLS